MAGSEPPIDATTRWVERQLRALSLEIHEACLASGHSQAVVARHAGISPSRLSRTEHGQVQRISLLVLAHVMTIVGLDLSVRAYPGAQPIRDRGQLELLDRLRNRVGPGFAWRIKVPMPIPGDRRAWDADIRGHGIAVGVDAEARLRDVQAVQRTHLPEMAREWSPPRDPPRNNTHSNRAVVRAHAPALRAAFPVSARSILTALATGRDPRGSAVVLL